MATVNVSAFPAPRNFRCINCSGSITLYDPAGCDHFICPNCHYDIHYTDNQAQIAGNKAPQPTDDPLLPIGTTGTLRGLPYKVIGYMEKREAGTEYYWKEYMLYNYQKGYAFLAEYNGHWSYIAGKDHFPEVAQVIDMRNGAVSCNDIEYSVYNSYQPVITGILGEYDWNVLAERVQAKEYIAPPFLLVSEHNTHSGHTDWYLGKYIQAAEIAKAFELNVKDFPHKIGVGANQPTNWYFRWQAIWPVSIFLLLALIVITTFKATLKPEKTVFNIEFPIHLSPAAERDSSHADSIYSHYSNDVTTFEFQPVASQPFKVNNTSALKFDLSTDVDDNWAEINMLLVNDKTNETWSITKSIEYYHGYDDDGSWSEGGTSATVYLSHIPAGQYHINIYPYSGNRYDRQVGVTVYENVTMYRNMFITMLVLALYPFFCWLLWQRIERLRWMGSDYSPYKKDSSDD